MKRIFRIFVRDLKGIVLIYKNGSFGDTNFFAKLRASFIRYHNSKPKSYIKGGMTPGEYP